VTYDLGRDPDGDLAEALGVVNLPTTVFATPDHRVVEVHTGALDEDQLREKMTRLLESA
jgi:thioredoxin-like negative regulator of GroEL